MKTAYPRLATVHRTVVDIALGVGTGEGVSPSPRAAFPRHDIR
jgi:hypothetical protein